MSLFENNPSLNGRKLSDLKTGEKIKSNGLQGPKYWHRRILDRKVIFDCSELRPNARAAFASIPSLRCGAAAQTRGLKRIPSQRVAKDKRRKIKKGRKFQIKRITEFKDCKFVYIARRNKYNARFLFARAKSSTFGRTRI
eukprot:sb/3474321/